MMIFKPEETVGAAIVSWDCDTDALAILAQSMLATSGKSTVLFTPCLYCTSMFSLFPPSARYPATSCFS